MSLDLTNMRPDVISDVQEWLGPDRDVKTLSPQEFFDAYCRWHGLIGYGPVLWIIAQTLIQPDLQVRVDSGQVQVDPGVQRPVPGSVDPAV